mmetsp:Transcript_136030/g.422654  ORF Transcript_136030/g.422654 Transcript_136030/m.422654 type:complete len:201 (-) Transcript_136030:4338-4940(-)
MRSQASSGGPSLVWPPSLMWCLTNGSQAKALQISAFAVAGSCCWRNRLASCRAASASSSASWARCGKRRKSSASAPQASGRAPVHLRPRTPWSASRIAWLCPARWAQRTRTQRSARQAAAARPSSTSVRWRTATISGTRSALPLPTALVALCGCFQSRQAKASQTSFAASAEKWPETRHVRRSPVQRRTRVKPVILARMG